MGISPDSGQPKLSLLDISTLSAPLERGSLKNVDARDIRIFSGDGNYAFVNDLMFPRGLLVISISSLSNPSDDY